MEEEWNISALEQKLATDFNIHLSIADWLKEDSTLDNQDIRERLLVRVEQEYAEKIELVGEEGMRQFEKNVMLNIIDARWREHLADMDYLRQGIHLRGYAQKNPKQEYKREAFEMFQSMWQNINYTVASLLISVQIEKNEEMSADINVAEPDNIQTQQAKPADMTDLAQADDIVVQAAFSPDSEDYSPAALEARGIVVHRNDPCPCGSGKKYKQCHGKLA
jgi:preprotein translocase subunit SecA